MLLHTYDFQYIIKCLLDVFQVKVTFQAVIFKPNQDTEVLLKRNPVLTQMPNCDNYFYGIISFNHITFINQVILLFTFIRRKTGTQKSQNTIATSSGQMVKLQFKFRIFHFKCHYVSANRVLLKNLQSIKLLWNFKSME